MLADDECKPGTLWRVAGFLVRWSTGEALFLDRGKADDYAALRHGVVKPVFEPVETM